MEFDTIAAISTPMGEGAIAIVRLSGEKSVQIVEKLFKSVGNKKLSSVTSHTIHYGHLINPKNEKVIEEVMVTVLRAPNTFTREDIVEINCHGGIVSANTVLKHVLLSGVRLAEPGEFTKRAFLNGRIDLSQAEAVMDLIRAKTDKAMNQALSQIEGRLSILIRGLRQQILETLAQVEVNIDYPEYDDVEEMTLQQFKEKGLLVKTELIKILETAEQGKILRDGISTAIIGRPNVGKSSLLNSLLNENKAIVTDIPGTTRDVIEEYVNVRGIPLKLIDTAGIRETEDIVEKIGVERSKKVLENADLVLLVLNSAEDFSREDEELFQLVESLKKKNVIIVLNKSDLIQKVDEQVLYKRFNFKYIKTSVFENNGVESLEKEISHMFFQGNIGDSDMTYVSNARHIALLNMALQSIEEALSSSEEGVPIDLVQIDFKKAWDFLGEIIGESVQEDLINQLFSQFCLGK
ncbi:MAG: tRNA modification GTPase [Bacillales bacterium]|jgi:tRNA modification GTPase|nr:tRNA modification GTPase [Bacillales bacterium]